MAEALAVVGIAASIISIVDFGSRVIERLNDYGSKVGEIPEAFRHIKVQLSLLLDALRQAEAAINSGSVPEDTKKALQPALEGCQKQIKSLDDIIAKVLPTTADSWARRGKKAISSLRYDGKVEKITAVINGYIPTLTYHHVATSSTPRHMTGITPS